MSHSRVVIRGVVFKDVEGSFRTNDGTKLGISASERLFRAPICEVKFGDQTVFSGKIGDLEGFLNGNLPPKLAATIELDGFLGEVAREVGHYQTFLLHDRFAGINVSDALPTRAAGNIPMVSGSGINSDLTVAMSNPPVHYMSAIQILDEIRANHSAYAVMTVPTGTVSNVWGKKQTSSGGFSIVAGHLDRRFPFARGTVEENNQFNDQILTYGNKFDVANCDQHLYDSNPNDKNSVQIALATQGGVKQVKIYIHAGDYSDQYGRPSQAIFVFNTKAELFDSIVNATLHDGRNYTNPYEAADFTRGLLALVQQIFPDEYLKANCAFTESKGLTVFAGIHTPK